MRVGVLGHTFVNWSGGLDFVRTVATALQASPMPIEVHLLLPVDGPLLRLRTRLRTLRDRVTGTPVSTPDRASIEAAVATFGDRITVHRIDIGHRALRRAARRLALDALIPALKPLPFGPELPWVGYVWDFQHRHLPQLFKPRSIARRDAAFAHMLRAAPAVIVNARAVADDIRRFVPQASARVFALPFSAQPEPSWFDAEPPLAQYGIEAPYFIVCNQFWKHKDHATAFRALARLRDARVKLVCTGNTSDFRDPTYFPGLMKQAGELGIASRLHVLGLVPKLHQVALLRGAVALVQPTLSEGGPGGGAAFDAVSLGVPALLSDIAVNREIDEPGVEFFRAGDADDLARHMQAMLDTPTAPRPSPQTLIEQGRARRTRCGDALVHAIEAARDRCNTRT